MEQWRRTLLTCTTVQQRERMSSTNSSRDRGSSPSPPHTSSKLHNIHPNLIVVAQFCSPENLVFLDLVSLGQSAGDSGCMLTKCWTWQSKSSLMPLMRPIKSSSCRRQPSCPSSDTPTSSNSTELSVMDSRYIHQPPWQEL